VTSDSPNRNELLTLLKSARDAVEESQRHWASVLGLTGDRRYRRQQHEVIALLDAMKRRVESGRQRSSD
jgi:hypothetical protein